MSAKFEMEDVIRKTLKEELESFKDDILETLGKFSQRNTSSTMKAARTETRTESSKMFGQKKVFLGSRSFTRNSEMAEMMELHELVDEKMGSSRSAIDRKVAVVDRICKVWCKGKLPRPSLNHDKVFVQPAVRDSTKSERSLPMDSRMPSVLEVTDVDVEENLDDDAPVDRCAASLEPKLKVISDRPVTVMRKQKDVLDEVVANGMGHRSVPMEGIELASRGGIQQFCQKVVKQPAFEAVSVFVIFASAVLIGLQLDHMMQAKQLETTTVFRLLDVLCLCFFMAECGLRLGALRWQFFQTWGWGWNVFDLLLILSQLAEELMHLLFVTTHSDEVKLGFATVFLLRVAKILRTVRVLRIFHVMRFADELRLLVSCILHSSKSFFWSSVLMLLTVYVFGVHLAQMTLFEIVKVDNDLYELTRWYGSVIRSMLSLFQALTGGVDWNDLVVPLITHISPWTGAMFFLFISFAILALMNVVTATFVQHASERATQMKQVQSITRASRLFRSLDADCSGVITIDEVKANLEKPEVREFFHSIDVDVSDARLLFDMLDHNNTGEIYFTEFMNGCLRLQSPAKALDVFFLLHEIREELRAQPTSFFVPPVSKEGPRT